MSKAISHSGKATPHSHVFGMDMHTTWHITDAILCDLALIMVQ